MFHILPFFSSSSIFYQSGHGSGKSTSNFPENNLFNPIFMPLSLPLMQQAVLAFSFTPMVILCDADPQHQAARARLPRELSSLTWQEIPSLPWAMQHFPLVTSFVPWHSRENRTQAPLSLHKLELVQTGYSSIHSFIEFSTSAFCSARGCSLPTVILRVLLYFHSRGSEFLFQPPSRPHGNKSSLLQRHGAHGTRAATTQATLSAPCVTLRQLHNPAARKSKVERNENSEAELLSACVVCAHG